MNFGKCAWLLLAAAPLLAGCGNFWTPPNGTGGTGGSSGCNTGSATYTVTAGSTVATGVQPLGLAEDSTGTYVMDVGSTYFDAYPFDATTTGKLDSQAISATTTNNSVAIVAGANGNLYILNAGALPQIVGYSIVSGVLNTISGSPWAVQSAPYAMTIAPNGNFLIVSTISGVYTYPISGGQLGLATVVSTDQAFAVQVDTTNKWLIEAIPGTSGVIVGAVPINSTTGADNGSEITLQFAVTGAALKQNQMVISSDNANIFIALGAGGTIVIPFNAANPLPSGTKYGLIPVLNSSGGSALSVAVDPGTSPRLFYIGETLAASSGTAGGLRAFSYSSLSCTTLTQATGSPIASGGLAPSFILPVTTPDFVYVANGTGAGSAGNIAGFAVSSTAAQ